jgi:hypoxanthine-DNA glycosylase
VPRVVTSFAPIVSSTSRVLILGSMPGVASLDAHAYYAHPRNAFWPILASITDVAADAPNAARVAGLLTRGLALWDVAGSCARDGSLDADIDDDSVVPNDIAGLVRDRPTITRVCLNGGKAAALWKRHVAPEVRDLALDVRTLPSTSPAHAGLPFAQKCARWREALLKDTPAR